MVKKPEGFETFRTISELAAYVGTSTRTMERWFKDGFIPDPGHVCENGMKLWSPLQASVVLSRRIRRLPSEKAKERRITKHGS